MYYLRARFYDPDLKRFISEDTHWNTGNSIFGDKNYKENEIRYPDDGAIMQSGNLYGYCSGNPIKYSDKSGKNLLNDAWKKAKNAFKHIDNTQKDAQRKFWKTGSQILLRNILKDYTAAWLLDHSL